MELENYTHRADSIVALAQDEARALEQDRAGTEHILLALVEEGQGVAAHALTSLGIDADVVRRGVGGPVGHGRRGSGGRVPFTPQAQQVLESALSEAHQIGQSYVGTEHILLALVRGGGSEDGAARVLLQRGLDADRVRHQVLQQLSTYQQLD